MFNKIDCSARYSWNFPSFALRGAMEEMLYTSPRTRTTCTRYQHEQRALSRMILIIVCFAIRIVTFTPEKFVS